MSTTDKQMENGSSNTDNYFTNIAIETAIKLVVIFLIVSWCFNIIRPFIIPVVWGIIIAVALYPLYQKLNALLGNRAKIAATIYTVLLLTLLITPTVMVSDSLIESATSVAKSFQKGEMSIPQPSQKVKEWPLVGKKVYKAWQRAATNFERTLQTYSSEVRKVGKIIISAAASAGGTVLQFLLSIVISGILLASAGSGYSTSLKISERLAGKDFGKQFIALAIDTIRSVAQGVIGIAVVQATLAALGLYVMDVPGWGLWTILILVLAIAQLPPVIILGPIVFYVFSVAETTPAVGFAIWSTLVMLSDGLLKPLVLGRGMSTPMLVILLGSIGGLMTSGIIGLFVGAVVLALGYELLIAWLNKSVTKVPDRT